MRTVTKEFTFDAAHRLVNGYKGKCAHLHGHTYKVQVTLALKPIRVPGDVTDSPGKLDQYGFVEDFDKVKKLKDWVDKNWDHATLVNAEDASLVKWLHDNEQKHFGIFIHEGNPTVENICQILYEEACEMLNTERVYVKKVKVWETPTSFGSYNGPS
jgi:6-pyruvoyltetrahydropterin/6-carboxytetrahydropterin synthase